MSFLRRIYIFLYRYAIFLLLLMIVIASIVLFWLQKKDDIKPLISKPEYHFYFIAQNSVDPFWKEAINGAQQAAKDNNVVVEFNSPRFNDPDEELKYLDIATISRVDGIITHASNSQDFTDAIDNAYNNKIPVITFENDDSESKRYAFVGTNNFIVGCEAARLLTEATGGKANIAVISSNESDQNAVEHNLKMNGFMNIIKNFPEMKVIKTYTSKMGILSAEEITQKIIDSEDDINAIFTFSSADTLGSAQLIVDRNKVGSIVLVGYGSSDEILRYIDKGIIFGTVASDSYEMGYKSIKAMVDIKEGKNVPGFIDTEVKVIKKDNLESMKSNNHVVE